MEAHTTCGKLVLDLDKILVEKKLELDGKERDLELRTGALAEAQAWGHNPQDNHDKSVEFVELWWLLWDAEVDHAFETSWLAALVEDVSQVLENLGMPPIPGIPPGSTYGQRHPGGGGCDPGAREGGI
jgi:hypothetical protein